MAKILIVEDDAFLRRAYETILTKEGYEVDTAQDGMDGLKKAQVGDYNLILLDMLMPELGGLDFLKAYDQKGKHPDVHIIVFSNMSVPENIEEARRLGAAQYMTKSDFSPKEMAELIKKTLS